MTIANIVILLVFVLLGGLAIGLAFRVQDLQGEAATLAVEKASAEFEVARLTQHAEDLLVPLTWTYDHVEAIGEHEPASTFGRLRAYLVACYLEVQKMILKDDVEMTDAMAEARSAQPPRRLPRYPQTPPFLARPEDAAGIISIQGSPLTEDNLRRIAQEWEKGRATPPEAFNAASERVGTPTPAQQLEATRYFVQWTSVSDWEEVDREVYEQVSGVHRMLKVDPFHPAALPEGVHAIIFAGREHENALGTEDN